MQKTILSKLKELVRLVGEDKRYALGLFILTIIVLFFVFDYHKIINKPPQSLHVWRQTDCLSQAINYAERNPSFFKPQIHALVSEDYQSGYCMEEFPVIFYVAGMLHKVFGNIELIFRIINLLIFFTGLYYLYRFQQKIFKSYFWAYFYTILLFTAPVILFYANNFILNIPAFSLTLIGWYYFFSFLESGKQKYLLTAFILFTFGPLLKISELISVFTLIGIIFLDYFKIIPFKNFAGRLQGNHLKIALYSLGAILIVFAWYYYSHYYNVIHQQTYYIYTTRSIFTASPEVKAFIYEMISDYWVKFYHNKIVLCFFAATFLINLVFVRKVNALLMAITSIMVFGSFLFVLLFFQFLRDHDYYVISLYIATIFSAITFTEFLLRNHYNVINSVVTKILFIALLVHSVDYGAGKLRSRYTPWENNVYLTERNDIYYIKPYLDQIGISKDALVISIPDGTPNVTLYLMNRRGWTNFIESNNARLIEMAIERGAEYLIINDPRLLSHNDVMPYLYHKRGEFRNTSIYKLDGIEDDSFYQRRQIETLQWDMETLTDDSLYIQSNPAGFLIPNRHVSTDFSFSGLQSLRVVPGDFGLNYNIGNLQGHEKYLVQVKVFSEKENTSNLIVCVSSPEEYYWPVSEKTEIESSDWKQISFQFVVPGNMRNNTLSIDFYNSDTFDIYLDDFSITRILDN